MNIWAASEQMWLCSQHKALQKMVQYIYSEIFPAKTTLNWVSMGLLPLQTHSKLITSLICFSLQCTGARKHNCRMPGTFSAHGIVSTATLRFPALQEPRSHPEKQRGALHGPSSAVCGLCSSTHPGHVCWTEIITGH